MRRREKSGIAPARWWVNPAGYEPRAKLVLQDQILATIQDERDGIRLEEYPSDTDCCPFENIDDEGEPLPWIVASKWRGPFDVPGGRNEPRSYGMREYEPLKVPGLHRSFAAIDGSETGVLAFMAEYGFLGVNTWLLETEDLSERYFGESLEEWRTESFRMRTLIGLYDLYRDPKTSEEALEEWIDVGQNAASFRQRFMDRQPGAFKYALSDEFYLQRIPPELAGEPLYRRAARTILREYVASELYRGTIPVIDVGPGSQLSLVPGDLLGAMYVLFMQELLGRADPLVRCASCGKWFVSRHASKIYCSDACKMKAYRQSKKIKETQNDGD